MAAGNKRRIHSSSASSSSELSSPGSSLSSLSPPPEDIDLQDWPPNGQDEDEDIYNLEGLPPLPREEEEDEYMPTSKARRLRVRSTASPAAANTNKRAAATKSRNKIVANTKRKAAALTKAAPTSKKKKRSRKLHRVKEITPEPVIDPDPDTIEYDPDTAIIVMFQTRFEPLFEDLADLGPQDLEEGVSSEEPSPEVEALLCRLLSLALNRKKPVEAPHYQRACEEAMTYRRTLGCPEDWLVTSPFGSGRSFRVMDWRERLLVLKFLVYWSLQQSHLVRQFVGTANSRKDQDTAVSPLGYDSQNRAYYLVEGNNDTRWKLYREAPSPYASVVSWAPVATSVDELKQLLYNGFDEQVKKEVKQEEGPKQEEGVEGPKPFPAINEKTKEGQLRLKIQNLLPQLENSELRRHRRDIRLQRKAAFEARAANGAVGIYAGRTRGVRINYANMSSDDGAAAAAGGGYESSDNNSSSGGATRALGTRRSARMMAMHSETPPAGTRRSGRLTRLYTPQEGDQEQDDQEEQEEGDYDEQQKSEEGDRSPESLTVVLRYHGKVEDHEGVKNEEERQQQDGTPLVHAFPAAAPTVVLGNSENPTLPSSTTTTTVVNASDPNATEKVHDNVPAQSGLANVPVASESVVKSETAEPAFTTAPPAPVFNNAPEQLATAVPSTAATIIPQPVINGTSEQVASNNDKSTPPPKMELQN